MQPGELCPECGKSRLYEINEKKVVRLAGHAPVQSYKYFLQQTRCVCGIVFTAEPPEEFKDLYHAEKYSPSALASLIIQKYFLGTSFGMIDKVQKMMGVPVIQAIVGVLKFLASNSRLLGFDDTHIRLLEKRITQKNTETNKGYCNSHMRRKVYTEDPNKKTALGNIILTAYKEIYQNDRHCK